MLTIERSLNVYAAGIPQIINLSQYDSDFQLVFNLYTSQGELTIPSGTTAEIQGTKKSGTGYSAAAALAGSTVTVTGDNQMTACAGANVFEISLKNNGKVLNSVNFILVVEPAALDGNTITDKTVLKELQAIIDSVADAEAAADRAEETAQSVEASAEQIETNKNDIADLKEDLKGKAPVIVNTSDETEVVTFADGADDMPMKSVVLKLVPHQEGTGDPSPSNVRPISGYTSVNVTRAGKNLFDISKVITNTGRVVNNGDGTLTIQTASNSSSAIAAAPNYLKSYADLKAGETYTLSGTSTGTNKFIYLAGVNLRWDFGTSKTITQAMLDSIVNWCASGVNSSATLSDIQIELGSTATPYEPYTGTTYPITIPSSAGTVYGGELDVVNGVLKVTHGYAVFDGSNDEEWAHGGGNRMLAPILGSYAEGYTRIAVTANRGVFSTGSAVGTIFLSNRSLYYYQPTDITTVSAFCSWLASNNLQVVYLLNTPTEITLDPTTIKTLLGTNTIWMSADGTLQADYPADTKMYIDALTAPDDDMIADSNIASGKYFTVNNRLYLSTSAIAQGEAIVVGTNCVKTDLATALNALNA